MTCRYTLMTETKPNLGELASRFFEGFTLIEGAGYWKGVPEGSTSIVVIGDNRLPEVYELAHLIRRENKQTAVLVTVEPLASARLVTVEGLSEVA